MATRPGATVSHAARDLAIGEGSLHEWIKQSRGATWVSDITYIWTLEGWLYLAAFLDLFSRIIAGWDVSDTPDAALCVRAFERAATRLARRLGSWSIPIEDVNTRPLHSRNPLSVPVGSRV